jgi:hypothetical protein
MINGSFGRIVVNQAASATILAVLPFGAQYAHKEYIHILVVMVLCLAHVAFVPFLLLIKREREIERESLANIGVIQPGNKTWEIVPARRS